MGTLLQDLKYGARSLWNNPGFTLVALLALALGIGATTAIYTVVDAVLLRPLPFPESQQLVSVQSLLRGLQSNASYPDYQDFVARNRTLAGISAYTPTHLVLTGGALPQQVQAVSATPNLFRVLGSTPALGRDFADDEAKAGSHVVIISYGLWQRRYNADPNIVGKTIEVEGEPNVIIGVAAAGLEFPLDIKFGDTEAYVPFPRTEAEVTQAKERGSHYLQLVGRLKPGVSVKQGDADLAAVVAGMTHDNPGDDGDEYLSSQILSLHEQLVGKLRPALIMLLLAVGCVLLIACANVAGLLLARATVRQREIAIRTALGAGRGRLVRQMLTESALLGLLGGGAGVLLALWLVDLLVAMVAPVLPKVHELVVDGRILGVTFVLSIVTGLVFGLVPALQASRADLNDALKETARSSAHTRTRRARNGLLMAEIAVALVLLVGAGMTLRSFAKLQHVNPGFQIEGMVVAQLRLPDQRYAKDEDADRYYRELTRAIKDLPGTESTAIGAPIPFTHSVWATSVQITGQPISNALTDSMMSGISPGYFQTLGIPLLSGRAFNDSDDQRKSAPTLVISKYFAEHLFPGRSAVGEHVTIGLNDTGQKGGTSFEVVGVVGDVLTRTLQSPTQASMYVPLGRWPIGFVGVVARTATPKAVIPVLRQAMLTVDKNLPPPTLTTMAELTAESLQNERMLMVLLGLFAAVALVLASIGIYGVMSYTVTQRTREIGIRVALGAGSGDVLRMVLGESLRLSVVAVVIGLAVALSLGRLVRSLLYGVSSADLLTLVPVTLLILIVCLVASYLPARRATKVDPMVALRYE